MNSKNPITLAHQHLFETEIDGTIRPCDCGTSWTEESRKSATLGRVNYEAWAKTRTADGERVRRWIDLAPRNRAAWERAARETVCEHVARCIASSEPPPPPRHAGGERPGEETEKR